MYKKMFLFLVFSLLFFIKIDPHIKAEESKRDKVAYLTFDDGPSDYTLKILSLLNQFNIKGTFFVIGENITPKTIPILNVMIDEGHYIGLHSMNHDYRTLYVGKNAPKRFVGEMLEEQAIIFMNTGFKTNLVRPPFSGGDKLTDRHIEELLAFNFRVWDWNVDTRDWSCKSVYQVMKNMKADLDLEKYPDKVVVLLHERKLSVYALPYVIHYLKNKGYRFDVYNPNEHFPINFRHYDYI